MNSFFWKWYSLESFVGSQNCESKRWEVYLNFGEITTFTNSVAHDTLKIHYQFNCNNKYTFSGYLRARNAITNISVELLM